MSKPGRRVGTPDTRADILEAARESFSEKGYARSTIRSIAASAGVDPALIHHYFGTKEELFAVSIDVPFPPAEKVVAAFADAGGDTGRVLAETFFSIWEQERPRASLLGMLRSAMGGEDRAVAAFRQFVTVEIQNRIAPLIGGEDARLRALLMASHLVGIAMTRYVVRLEPMASTSIEEIIDLVAPRIQSYLDD
ncbi:MAG: TetR family transcriptional regulator [Acidimicrobiia bacterium]